MTRRATVGGSLVASLLVLAATAAAQPPLIGPPIADRLPPAPMLIVPSLTLSGEYNDNVQLNNNDRRSDGIFGITPGLDFLAQSPTYRLLTHGEVTTIEYINNTDLSRTLGRSLATVDGSYRTSPALTLVLRDAMFYDRDSGRANIQGVTTGHDRALGNTVTPGADWFLSPTTRVLARLSYSLLRFGRKDVQDSDVVHGNARVEHELTPTFGGLLGYDFGYYDVKESTTEPALQATSHTPLAGFNWRLTQLLTWRLEAGPAVVLLHHRLFTVPTGATDLTRRFSWGTATLRGDSIVTTGGGLGGPVLAYGGGGLVRVTELMRGFVFEFGPRFTKLTSIQGNAVDLSTLTVPLYVSYPLTRWLNLVGAYTFYRQHSESTLRTTVGTIAADVDQNRVSLGVQIYYPVRID
jgi:hypothetical protein